jgi:hypothetical protein
MWAPPQSQHNLHAAVGRYGDYIMKTAVARSGLSSPRFRFKVSRAFKALDDGVRRKWVLVLAAKDLPPNLPLDANARVPNILKNPTCRELRETLLGMPEMFQVFNGGIVCTASTVEAKQEGNDHYVEVTFDAEAEQGIVNGGHTYATLLNVLHGSTTYSDGNELKSVLMQDVKKGSKELAELVLDEERLLERIARAREKAQVQMEFVAPVADGELLAQIARARNLSQGVEATALANLAGKFDFMKGVLADAPDPFGPNFVERVVWKTNQVVPEDSRAVPVKLLIDLVSLMDFQAFPPDSKVANVVFTRSVLVIREFSEAEGDAELHLQALTRLLPEFIRLYEHIYTALPEIDPTYPWSDGKLEPDRKRRRTTALTPLLSRPAPSRVNHAFVWPIYSAFRALLEKDNGQTRFREDPIELFEDLKAELTGIIQSFHKNQAHGLVQQVGKDKEVWVRLDNQIDKEISLRKRLAQAR